MQQHTKTATHGTREKLAEQERANNTLNAMVVVVGAGPTGLTVANLLGKFGIHTLLIERNPDIADCPRAISIDDEGLRICQAIGLSESVMQHMLFNIEACYVSDKKYLARVFPREKRNGFPLIATFHQPTFESILLDGLKRFPCVSVHFQHHLASFEQDSEGVSLLVRTPDEKTLHIRCRYLLACDGGQSDVRHALHIPLLAPSLLPISHPRTSVAAHEVRTIGRLDQRWISVDCIEPVPEDDPLPRTIGYFFSDYRRPAVTVPAPFGGRRWEFLVHPHEQPEGMLDDESLFSLMRQTLEHAPQDIYQRSQYRGNDAIDAVNAPDSYSERPHVEVSSLWRNRRPHILRRTVYTFHTAIAERFSQGRVFLLGDAAHLMPPFAGQGMNSGLRDALNLCWKLRLVLCENAHPRLLASYFKERFPHVKRMTLFTSLPGRMLTTPVRSFAWGRDRLFHTFNLIPGLRRGVEEMRVKPASRYPRGFFLPSVKKVYKKYTGLLLPQPTIITMGGQKLLLDEVLGDGFTLIKYCETAHESQQLHTLMHDEAWFGVCAVALHTTKQHSKECTGETHVQHVCMTENMPEQPFPLLLRRPRLCLLVRPDHHIFGVFDIDDASEAVMVLKKMLRDRSEIDHFVDPDLSMGSGKNDPIDGFRQK